MTKKPQTWEATEFPDAYFGADQTLLTVGGSITSVTVPYNSSQGSRVFWDVYAVNGYGSVSRKGGFMLDTSSDINGMLTVTVDKLQVAAVLGGNVKAQDRQYLVTLPIGTGYR